MPKPLTRVVENYSVTREIDPASKHALTKTAKLVANEIDSLWLQPIPLKGTQRLVVLSSMQIVDLVRVDPDNLDRLSSTMESYYNTERHLHIGSCAIANAGPSQDTNGNRYLSARARHEKWPVSDYKKVTAEFMPHPSFIEQAVRELYAIQGLEHVLGEPQPTSIDLLWQDPNVAFPKGKTDLEAAREMLESELNRVGQIDIGKMQLDVK